MRHQRIRLSRAVLPNAVTALSVFAGYLSILYTFEGYYGPAAWLIILAGVLDMFDGRIARIVGGSSKFGTQFDSLADAINYGIAPSLLFFRVYFADWGFAGILVSFLPTVCGALRLARYNVLSDAEEGRVGFFIGLPTTMAAAFLASYVIFAGDLFANYGSRYVAAVLLILASLLMVSTVHFDHNRVFTDRRLLKHWKGLLVVAALATMILFPTKAFFAWLAFYILYGLARSMVTQLQGQGQ